MNKPDEKKPPLSQRNMDKFWNDISGLPVALGVIVALVSAVMGSRVIPALSIFFGLAGVAYCKSRATEQELRHIWFALLLPAAAGVSLAIYPFQHPGPAILGVGASILIGWWLLVLRYPPELRSAWDALRAGSYTQALNLLNHAIQSAPRMWEGYQTRSAVYLKLCNAVEAERDALRALQLQPNNPVCLTTLGNVRMAQERPEEADGLFAKALELAPRTAINYYNVGTSFYRRGEFEQAAAYLQAALDKRLTGECCLYLHYHLGRSLSHLGDITGAAAQYAALRNYRDVYERFVKEAADAPDYPGVLATRRQLQDMKEYMG